MNIVQMYILIKKLLYCY